MGIEPPTLCVFDRIMTTQAVNFAKYMVIQNWYVFKHFWANTKNDPPNLSVTIFICFQNLIKIWSFLANFDISIVETEDQQNFVC